MCLFFCPCESKINRMEKCDQSRETEVTSPKQQVLRARGSLSLSIVGGYVTEKHRALMYWSLLETLVCL